jgi:hypothetical protein
MSKRILAVMLLAAGSSSAFCQTNNPAPNAALPANSAAPGNAPAAANTKASTLIGSSKIPSGSKIYVAPMGGFENYVIAGILKKKVAVTIVADRDKAEYEILGSAETEKAGWAKMLFLGSQNSNEQASINVREIKTDTVVFAYSVNKLNSARGKQSAGEAIGKHLNEAVGKD